MKWTIMPYGWPLISVGWLFYSLVVLSVECTPTPIVNLWCWNKPSSRLYVHFYFLPNPILCVFHGAARLAVYCDFFHSLLKLFPYTLVFKEEKISANRSEAFFTKFCWSRKRRRITRDLVKNENSSLDSGQSIMLVVLKVWRDHTLGGTIIIPASLKWAAKSLAVICCLRVGS